MSKLEKIISEIGLDKDESYFKLNEEHKKQFISLLWDEMYGNQYYKTLVKPQFITPIDMEWDIINNLNYLKELFLKEEKYEETQLVQDLFDITQNKLNQIRNYANTTKTNRDGE